MLGTAVWLFGFCFGLWWLLLPGSVSRFYGNMTRASGGRAFDLSSPTIRLVGALWTVLYVAVTLFNSVP